MIFKPGDKIKATSNSYVVTSFDNEWEGIVLSVDAHGNIKAKTTHSLNPEDLGTTWWCLPPEDFVLINDMLTIEDLQFGDIVTFTNRQEYVYADLRFYGKNNYYQYDSELVSKKILLNVKKVERKGQTIWEDKSKKTKMTLSEISKKLGYEIELEDDE